MKPDAESTKMPSCSLSIRIFAVNRQEQTGLYLPKSNECAIVWMRGCAWHAHTCTLFYLSHAHRQIATYERHVRLKRALL